MIFFFKINEKKKKIINKLLDYKKLILKLLKIIKLIK